MSQRRWRLVIGGLLVALGATSWQMLRLSAPSDPSTVAPSGSVLGVRTAAAAPISQPPLVAVPELTVAPIAVLARSGLVIDAESGTVLIGSNEHEPVPVASTTKIMTAIVLLKSGRSLDDVVTLSPAAVAQIGSDTGAVAGERFTLRDLLTGLLMVSGNDAAYAIAEEFGGLSAFVATMNETARTLGLSDSHFADPAGLDDTGRSTAFDLAMAFRYVLTFDEFRTIIATPQLTLTSESGYQHDFTSSNRLIRPDESLYLPSALGGKTGYTPDAGHCLIAAARADGHLLITAVLHTFEDSASASAREAHRLLRWTAEHTNWDS